MLDYVRERSWRSGENLARWRGKLADLLQGQDRMARVKHHLAWPWMEVPAFMAR